MLKYIESRHSPIWIVERCDTQIYPLPEAHDWIEGRSVVALPDKKYLANAATWLGV